MLLTYTRTFHFSVTASPSCSFFLSRCSVQFPTKWSLVGLVVAEHYFALLSARFRWISSNLGARRSFLTIDRATLRYARMWKTLKEMYGLYLQFLSVFFTHWLRRIVFPAVCFRWRLSVVAKHTRALLGDRTNLTDDLLAPCWLLLLLITYAWRTSSEPVNYYYTSWVGKTVPRLFSQ